jgi:hypothetical protein
MVGSCERGNGPPGSMKSLEHLVPLAVIKQAVYAAMLYSVPEAYRHCCLLFRSGESTELLT